MTGIMVCRDKDHDYVAPWVTCPRCGRTPAERGIPQSTEGPPITEGVLYRASLDSANRKVMEKTEELIEVLTILVELREALKTFGRHTSICWARAYPFSHDRCDCGLTQAIRLGEPEWERPTS